MFSEVDITLPAYGCELYIDAMMESLISQDFEDFRILARDDCSKDGTAARLAAWRTRFDNRMVILAEAQPRNLGVIGNYNAALAAATAPMVAIADPDDVWLPKRLTTSRAALTETVAILGEHTPIAVCTDAMVIDQQDLPVAPSYWDWARMNPKAPATLARTAMESVALGPTMMVNRALLERALPIAADAPNPDWWLALVAVAFGKLIVLPEPTIRYRRHTTNHTTVPFSTEILSAVARTLRSPSAPGERLARVLANSMLIARVFLERYGSELSPSDHAALMALVGLRDVGPLQRRAEILRHGLWFGSPTKNAAMIAFL